mgnify:CR=1 FL=1
MKRIFQSWCFSVLAALIGLVTAQLIGVAWWPPGAGLTLIGIGLVSASCSARMLAVRWHLPASVLASGAGAMVACFFAGATAEMLPAGSLEWMWKGGLYGACFGLPVAFILGPIGLVENKMTSGSTSDQ